MSIQLALSALLFAALAASSALAQSPVPNPPLQPAAPASPPVQISPNSQAPAKHRKVYTNEDFDALPHEANVNGGRDLLDQVNSCDRNCFDQIARAVSSPGGLSAHWKQSLLNAIDKVKEDLPWQNLLGEAIAIQFQSCELQVKKRQDLDRFSDPRTVTHSELLVEREYEPKFREMTRRLNEVLVRANAHVTPITDPYQAQFMRTQLDRVVHANCNIVVSQTQPRRDPEDADDPPQQEDPPSDDEQ